MLHTKVGKQNRKLKGCALVLLSCCFHHDSITLRRVQMQALSGPNGSKAKKKQLASLQLKVSWGVGKCIVPIPLSDDSCSEDRAQDDLDPPET